MIFLLVALAALAAMVTATIIHEASRPPAEDTGSVVPDTPEEPSEERRGVKRRIVGLKSPRLEYTSKTAFYRLTQTTFDTTTRDDAAEILLTNNTGAEQTLTHCAIYGLVVYEVPAWLHDDLEDAGDQMLNGLKKWELGNGFIIDESQVNQVADYWWKYFLKKKHYYTVTAPGNWLWLEPAEFYTMVVGGVGKSESINALVELINVRVAMDAKQLGSTAMVFREVESNWTYTINAVARYLASGKGQLATYQNKMAVSANGVSGTADLYCDGAYDQVQIQAAIDYLDAQGGGEVVLSDGTFTLAAAIVLKSNIMLSGQGPGTVLEPFTNTGAIIVYGTDGNEILGAGIRNFKIKRTAVLTADCEDVNLDYADRFFAHAVEFDADAAIASPDPHDHTVIKADNCDDLFVMACDLRMAGYGINAVGCSGQILSNTISMSAPADKQYTIGVRVEDSPRFLVSGNTISNLINSRPGFINLTAIYVLASKNSSIKDNTVENIRAIAQTSASSTSSGISTSGAWGGSAAEITGNLIRDVHDWYTSIGGAPGIIVHSNTDDVSIAGNHIEHADIGIEIAASTCERTSLSGNFVTNCGQLIDYGNCEDANEPMVFDETVPYTTQVTSWARRAVQVYEGNYSYEMSATGGANYIRLDITDDQVTTNLHGLIAGVEYTLNFWAFVASGGITPTDITAHFYDYVGGFDSTAVTFVAPADAWQEITLTHTIRAAATGTVVRLIQVATGNHAAGDKVYIDNVRLYPTNHQNAHENCCHDDGTDTRF